MDGKIRFAPDQPSTIHGKHKIVNYLDIDKSIINRAEEEAIAEEYLPLSPSRGAKLKTEQECNTRMASFRLSDKFDAMCQDKFADRMVSL